MHELCHYLSSSLLSHSASCYSPLCASVHFLYDTMMAPEWAMQLGMESAGLGPAAATVPAYIYGIPAAETLRVDDLLDFTNHDILPSSSSSSSSVPAADASLLVSPNQLSPEAALAFAADSAKPISFPDDIYIPSEEVAELEWLSKFVEDSFSDVPIQSIPTDTMEQSMMNIHRPVASAAAGRGARSKRSRGFTISSIGGGESGGGMQHHTVGSAWASPTTSSSSSEIPTPEGGSRKNEAGIETGMKGGGVRRCTHCASDKTPQWRTGPLGPKTLCNACGVRYKSGRLVPEYRPAASPTFVLTQHSNSHRKVMELRRQKELLVLHRQEGASSRFSSAAGQPQIIFHEFEIC